ncbi:unnamed protein product [Malus baccata var. baccata]
MYVLNNAELKKEILDEAHVSTYAMHPGVRDKYSLSRLAELFILEIIKYHRVPVSIISDRDPRFTSKFCVAFQEALGSRLLYSAAYHPQTDGQLERTIQTLEDMLRSSVLQFGNAWQQRLDLMEFAYNNSYYSSVGMTHFEALYGKSCRTPLCWSEVIKFNLKAAHNRQKNLTDKHATDRVYEVAITVKRCSAVRKKRYIGLYQITERVGEVAYRLELPPELSKESVTILDWKDKVMRNKTVHLVKVLWRNHSVEEATWKTEDRMKEIVVLVKFGHRDKLISGITGLAGILRDFPTTSRQS